MLFFCFFGVFFEFHDAAATSLPSGSAGRVMLSKEDKEVAKMGLAVFTVRQRGSHLPREVEKKTEKSKKALKALCPCSGWFL